MTANHAHTPSTEEEIRDDFSERQAGAMNRAIARQNFDRMIAAAEQRGAIKALENASKAMKKFAVTQSSDKQGTYIHAANMLLDRALHRADQEGDDE